MLGALFNAHSGILSLHSFQNLTGQAVIQAETMALEVKNAMSVPMTVLAHLAAGIEEKVEPESSINDVQLDQSDVDPLFFE